VPSHDPLLIDWHPHSGVATITFPYDATLHHADSAGNGGIIADHGLQWMNAGSGISHGGDMWGMRPTVNFMKFSYG